MPMIDVYAATGTFRDTHTLARDLATAVMTVERVPDIPMFRDNTAAFVHELPATALRTSTATAPTSASRFSPTPARSTATSSSQSWRS